LGDDIVTFTNPIGGYNCDNGHGDASLLELLHGKHADPGGVDGSPQFAAGTSNRFEYGPTQYVF
jgi:hypothetical protein